MYIEYAYFDIKEGFFCIFFGQKIQLILTMIDL